MRDFRWGAPIFPETGGKDCALASIVPETGGKDCALAFVVPGACVTRVVDFVSPMGDLIVNPIDVAAARCGEEPRVANVHDDAGAFVCNDVRGQTL